VESPQSRPWGRDEDLYGYWPLKIPSYIGIPLFIMGNAQIAFIVLVVVCFPKITIIDIYRMCWLVLHLPDSKALV
jgi:hypothetical protein